MTRICMVQAENFRNGGGMPSMEELMNNPQLAQSEYAVMETKLELRGTD